MPKIKNPAFDGMVPITPPAPKPEVLTKENENEWYRPEPIYDP